MKKALIIIDVQNDYFPNGKSELFQSEEVLEKIIQILKYFRKNGFPVYYIKHISKKEGAGFFLPNTKGAEIHEKIRPLSKEKVIVKHFHNSFFKTELHKELQKDSINELVICGMMTHMCVDTTVRAGKDLGYNIILIEDGCTTKGLEWNGMQICAEAVQNVYMSSLNNKFAKVMKLDGYWGNFCQTEQFYGIDKE
ncbi:MAG: cysteine hydrolase family protein [Leptotrichiaceae bacterium]|nr:cysteine hydrolase family protein [Leptotrichiaceae bacterium]